MTKQQAFGLPTPRTSPTSAEAFLQNRTMLFVPTVLTVSEPGRRQVRFTLPSWCRCDVHASRVRFVGPGIEELFDMATHEAFTARRGLAWEVRFRSTQPKSRPSDELVSRRWPRPRPRPALAGADPRLLIGLIVLVFLLGPVLAPPWIRVLAPLALIAVMAYVWKGRQTATQLATALNALHTQHWSPKARSSG